MTVDVLMSEEIDPVAANQATTWTVSAGTINTATLQPDGRTVRLALAAPAIPGDVTFGTAPPVAATGNIDLTAQVTDGDTVTVSDGSTAFVFEFTSGGGASGTNVEVNKGVDASAAIAALITAINGQEFAMTATAGAGDSADLTNDDLGDDGNVLLAETDAGGAITLTGMANGFGIEDLSGNVLDMALAALTLAPSELDAPTVTSFQGTTIEGADNDQIVVQFDDNMVQAEVENLASWTVEAPVGTSFDLTNATVAYDDASMTATVTLGAGTIGTVADGNNLQTFDSIAASFTTMRDLSGNLIPATTIGVDAVSATVLGDDTPPMVLTATADDMSTTLQLNFSEPTRQVAFGDLYAGGTDAGPRILLDDPDNTPAVPATGSVALTADPADGDTVTIDDGATSVTFEYDNNASVSGGNVSVAIAAADTVSTTANLQAAVAGSALTITAVANVATCELTHDTAGVAGNVAITEMEAGTAITVAGMSGGAEDVSATVSPVVTLFAWGADGLSATVDYDPVVPSTATDSLMLYGIEDLAGNQLLPVAASPLVAPDATVPALSAGLSTVTAVSGEANDVIQVRFGSAMSPFNITEPDNYTAAPLDLSTASFAFDGVDLLTITLDGSMPVNAQFGGSADVTLVNNAGTPLMTTHGVAIAANDNEMVAITGDSTPISSMATSASVAPAGSPNMAIVVFPEAVDTTGAGTLTNYSLNAANPTAMEFLTPRVVQLTFASQPAASDTLTIEVAAGTDLSGNPAAAQMMLALVAPETTAPTASVTAIASSGEGGDRIQIDFDEPVDLTSALDLTNYAFLVGGTPLSTTGATIDYESSTETVSIELPSGRNMPFGATFDVTVTSVTDVFGNTLSAQPSSVLVTGDNVAPGLLAAGSAYINWIEDNSGLTIDVFFDEAVDATFVGNIGNWGTSGATVIADASRVAPNMARVVTTTQIGAMETLQLTGVPDVAGNTSGALNVDPFE